MGRTAESSLNALLTYYNYIQSWEVVLVREYGDEPLCQKTFLDRQRALLPSMCHHVQTGPLTQCQTAFWRGMLTLRAIGALDVRALPDIAPTANLWLPVQVYYTIHALGIAALATLGQGTPSDHRSFRSAFSQTLRRRLPYPFSAACDGGPSTCGFRFHDLSTTATQVSALSNLADPARVLGDHYLGKTLYTTRHKSLESLFDEQRHRRVIAGRKRRNLTAEAKAQIAQRLHPTSIADLLYRMRERSNYKDAEMYLAGFDDTTTAAAHYLALQHLARVLSAGLCAMIAARLGPARMAQLEARLPA